MKIYRVNPDPSEKEDEYIQKTRQDRERQKAYTLDSAQKTRLRRLYGSRIGIFTGLVFGLVAELLNLYLVPGVLLGAPPLGALGNFIMCGVIGSFIGWAVSFPEDTFSGISLGCLSGIAAIEVRAWLTPGAVPILRMITNPVLVFFALIVFSLMVLLLSPYMLLWRFSLETQLDHFKEPWWIWRRIRLPLAMGAVAAFAGSFFVFPADTRQMIVSMDQLVRLGISVSRYERLPEPLQNTSAGEIMKHAEESYVIDIQHNASDDEGTSIRSYFGEAGFISRITLVARFHDGWSLLCTFQSPTVQPFCRGEGSP